EKANLQKAVTLQITREPESLAARVYQYWQFLGGAGFLGFCGLIITTQRRPRFRFWRVLIVAVRCVCLILVISGFDLLGQWSLLWQRIPCSSDSHVQDLWQKSIVCFVALILTLFGMLELSRYFAITREMRGRIA